MTTLLTAALIATPFTAPTPAPEPQGFHYPVKWGLPGTVQEQVAGWWDGDDSKILCVVGKETGQTFDPAIVSPSGKYGGLIQADSDFWRTYGGLEFAPTPQEALVGEQMLVAERGHADRGWAPWPNTSRGC